MRNCDLRVHLYPTSRGQWRWRASTRNGRIVAASTEAYTRRKRCWQNIQTVLDTVVPERVRFAGNVMSRFVVYRQFKP